LVIQATKVHSTTHRRGIGRSGGTTSRRFARAGRSFGGMRQPRPAGGDKMAATTERRLLPLPGIISCATRPAAGSERPPHRHRACGHPQQPCQTAGAEGSHPARGSHRHARDARSGRLVLHGLRGRAMLLLGCASGPHRSEIVGLDVARDDRGDDPQISAPRSVPRQSHQSELTVRDKNPFSCPAPVRNEPDGSELPRREQLETRRAEVTQIPRRQPAAIHP
jgi:hypothetical protein